MRRFVELEVFCRTRPTHFFLVAFIYQDVTGRALEVTSAGADYSQDAILLRDFHHLFTVWGVDGGGGAIGGGKGNMCHESSVSIEVKFHNTKLV